MQQLIIHTTPLALVSRTRTNGPEYSQAAVQSVLSPYDMKPQQVGLAMWFICVFTVGLEGAAVVGCLVWFFGQVADIFFLLVCRCAEHTLRDNSFFPDNYHPYFMDNYEDPRLNGVAIYCKQLPKAIIWGLGFDEFDSQGLYIQADYADVSVGSVLVPSGVGGPGAMAEKMAFLSQLSSHLEKVRNKRRGYILCGGWELMAHHADAEDAGNSTSLPGLTASERGWLLDLFSSATPMLIRRLTPSRAPTPGGLTATTPEGYAPIHTLFRSYWSAKSSGLISMTKKPSPTTHRW